MTREWPVRTLGTLGATLAIDTAIILFCHGPLACGGGGGGSLIAALLGLAALALVVVGTSALTAAGQLEARTQARVPVYALIVLGVAAITGLSLWAAKCAWASTLCGGWLLGAGG